MGWFSKPQILSSTLAHGPVRVGNLTRIRVALSGAGIFSLRADNCPGWPGHVQFVNDSEHELFFVVPTACTLRISMANIAGRSLVMMKIDAAEHGISDLQLLMPKLPNFEHRVRAPQIYLKSNLLPITKVQTCPVLAVRPKSFLPQFLLFSGLRFAPLNPNKIAIEFRKITPRIKRGTSVPQLPPENVKIHIQG
jgi:hypothetical protein